MIVCFDVGGTGIKAGIFEDSGSAPLSTREAPAHADRPCAEIVARLAELAAGLYADAPRSPLRAVYLAFPGPFDYAAGICLMRGIGKYDALYGQPLGGLLCAALQARLPGACAPGLPIRFVNDVAAFAYGYLYRETRAVPPPGRRSLYICLGTGCGSAFAVGRALVGAEVAGVPADGYVYPTPFKEGILDEYLSKRGLLALSQAHCGQPLEGLALAGLAARGDAGALQCFAAFGQNLADGLAPFLTGFQPHTLVVGGQVVRSGQYFLTPLCSLCAANEIELITEDQTSLRSMRGMLYKNKFEGELRHVEHH